MDLVLGVTILLAIELLCIHYLLYSQNKNIKEKDETIRDISGDLLKLRNYVEAKGWNTPRNIMRYSKTVDLVIAKLEGNHFEILNKENAKLRDDK